MATKQGYLVQDKPTWQKGSHRHSDKYSWELEVTDGLITRDVTPVKLKRE
jgi:hypothetical protein